MCDHTKNHRKYAYTRIPRVWVTRVHLVNQLWWIVMITYNVHSMLCSTNGDNNIETACILHIHTRTTEIRILLYLLFSWLIMHIIHFPCHEWNHSVTFFPLWISFWIWFVFVCICSWVIISYGFKWFRILFLKHTKCKHFVFKWLSVENRL